MFIVVNAVAYYLCIAHKISYFSCLVCEFVVTAKQQQLIFITLLFRVKDILSYYSPYKCKMKTKEIHEQKKIIYKTTKSQNTIKSKSGKD